MVCLCTTYLASILARSCDRLLGARIDCWWIWNPGDRNQYYRDCYLDALQGYDPYENAPFLPGLLLNGSMLTLVTITLPYRRAVHVAHRSLSGWPFLRHTSWRVIIDLDPFPPDFWPPLKSMSGLLPARRIGERDHPRILS